MLNTKDSEEGKIKTKINRSQGRVDGDSKEGIVRHLTAGKTNPEGIVPPRILRPAETRNNPTTSDFLVTRTPVIVLTSISILQC